MNCHKFCHKLYSVFLHTRARVRGTRRPIFLAHDCLHPHPSELQILCMLSYIRLALPLFIFASPGLAGTRFKACSCWFCSISSSTMQCCHAAFVRRLFWRVNDCKRSCLCHQEKLGVRQKKIRRLDYIRVRTDREERWGLKCFLFLQPACVVVGISMWSS